MHTMTVCMHVDRWVYLCMQVNVHGAREGGACAYYDGVAQWRGYLLWQELRIATTGHRLLTTYYVLLTMAGAAHSHYQLHTTY